MEAQDVKRVKMNVMGWWAWAEDLEFGPIPLLSCSSLFQTAGPEGALRTFGAQPLNLQTLPR